MGEFGKATGGISIESEFDEHGKYKVISIGSYSEESKYTDQGIRVYKTKKTESRILNKNDLVMILNDKTSSGNIIGRVLLVDKDNTYVYNQRTERIEINKSKFLPEYLYQLLNSDNIREKIICASQGNTQIYVNWTIIREFTYKITTDIEEQGKIARFFISLDHLITLHQSKFFGYILKEIVNCTLSWEQRKVGSICLISTGKSNTQDRVEDGKYPFYVRSSIVERSNRYLFDEEAVLTVGDGVGTGKVFHYVDGKYDLHQRVYRMFDFEKDISAKYFFYYFSNNFYDRVMAMTAKTSVDSVRYEVIADMDIIVPHIKEQKFIADIFQNFDYLITLHQRKLQKLKIIKKSMHENLFSQNGEKTPKIRFSGFTKDWEQRKLGEIAERIVRKNEKLESTLPLTISAQYGLIDQNEFFDKRIASKDVRGYYLIKKGEFAYNKSTSVDAPLGAIKRLDKYNNGVLSTLYILFKIIDDTSTGSDYLVTYYATDLWHRGIQSIAAEGARNHGLLNIAPNDFFETMLSIPLNISEQKKVGDFFISLDHLITLHQLEPYKLIFKAIAYRIIDYAKSKPLSSIK